MLLKCVFLAMAICAIAAKTPENMDSKYRVKGEYIVAMDVPNTDVDRNQYAGQVAEKIKALSEKVKIDRTFIFNKVIFLVVFCEDELVMSQAFELPEVRVVEANLKQPGIAQNCETQNTGSSLWGLSRVAYRPPPNYSTAQYSYATNDGDTTVAYVVDSGIYIEHNDYEGRAVRGYTAKNLMESEGEEDLNGHGTHCAGTIMGATHGVAKSAKAIAVKIISGQGFYTGADFLDGVNWMFEDFVENANAIGTAYKAVASMSLGGGASSVNDLAVQECIDAGLSVVAAAMNENTNACTYSPARMADVVTVGATDISERLASFSNWGTCVKILGPGVNIRSTFIGGPDETQVYSGTSMATPHVAGTILRYMTQIGYRPSPAAVSSWLSSTSTKDVIDLRGQTSTPNLLLYAPCYLTREGHMVHDVIEPQQFSSSGHGHKPGHGPPSDLPYLYHKIEDMQAQIQGIFRMSIAIVAMLCFFFLTAIASLCYVLSFEAKPSRIRHQWHQSNIASIVNKPSA